MVEYEYALMYVA